MRLRQEREVRNRQIPGLLREHGKVDAAPVDARRRAGLEPTDPEGQCAQPFRKGIRGRVARASARLRLKADMNPAARGRYPWSAPRSSARKRSPIAVTAPTTASSSTSRSTTGCWNTLEVFRRFDDGADRVPIQGPVGLRPGRAAGGALAGIQNPKLNAGRIRCPGHGAVERVDLPHQMALADAADSGIAGHLPDGFDALGQQQRRGAGHGQPPGPLRYRRARRQ